MSNDVKLSVLDLVPVRTDQTSGQALAASTALAQRADALGYQRYWVAEHHNMPAIVATSPPVLIAHLAAHTDRIRLGSGGVMLPNHASLAVAEQFALLEAAHPGRIDLGIGRAPGTDRITSQALQGPRGADIENFPSYVRDVLELLGVGHDPAEPAGTGGQLDEGDTPQPDGFGAVRIPLRDASDYVLRATPAPASAPTVWLLGSSGYSAQLAAALGLPYVFAHHFSGHGTAEALELYRSSFQPSAYGDAPRTFLTVNAIAADTEQRAQELARPQLLGMARMRTGAPLQAVSTVEQAAAAEVTTAQQQLIDSMRGRWLIGTGEQVAGQVRELAAQFDVDEVMIHPNASAYDGTDPAASPERERTLELLAKHLI